MDKTFNLLSINVLYMLNWCKKLPEDDLGKIKTCRVLIDCM